MNKRLDPAILAASMATPDDDVALPARALPNSIATMAQSLAVGECFSRVKKVDDSLTLSEYAEQIAGMRETFRSTINSSVRRARERNGAQFEVEIADVNTGSRGVYIVGIVTRTA